MPKAWADDPVRRSRAHAPEAVDFATKPAIARSMIERALSAGIPFSWVVADSIYGVGDIEMALRRAGKDYVLGVSAKHACTSWRKAHAVGGTAGGIAEDLPPEAWQRLSTGAGIKGERFHDLAYLDLADLDADEFNADLSGFWTRGLLIRRNIADGNLAYFTTRSPRGTTMETLVRVEGHRWAIEDSFETAKNELGLDHDKTRSWHGWHRHVSLAMLAFAMMADIRHRANSRCCADLSPAGPSLITRVCRLDFGIRVPVHAQARRARRPQIAQALGALVAVP